ncbi:MAG: aminotransferase class V-fold PLP-dependent enzyme [Chloroflexota bacterium]
MATAVDLDEIRAQLPSTRNAVYLNTGTCGPLPLRTAQLMAAEAEAEVLTGRIAPDGFPRLRERIAELRLALGEVVGAQAGEAAFSHSTTEGMNIATWGLEWKPGDEVVTTSQEHAGGLLPLYVLHRRKGVRVTFADVGNGEADRTLDALGRAIRPGVKAVVVSHVLYTTGAVLPLREIVDLAHRARAVVIADAAQSAGAIPIDVHALGVDAYAFSGQKWLLGPEGTGGFYVNPDRLEEFQPTFVNGLSIDHDAYRWDAAESFVPAPGAARYEFAVPYRPGVVAMAASLAWVRDEVGRESAYALIAENARHAWERAREIPGAEVLTPEGQLAGLLAFKIRDQDPVKTVERLAAENVLIRTIPENGALRISTGFYNTRAEIDRALDLIAT